MDDTPPHVEAIAVKDGRILALGSGKDIRQYQSKEMVMQNLGGRVLSMRMAMLS